MHYSEYGGNLSKPIQGTLAGLQRDPNAAPPRPSYSIVFQSDCQLTAIDKTELLYRRVLDGAYPPSLWSIIIIFAKLCTF